MTQQVYNPADYPPGLVAVPATDWMWTQSVIAFMHLGPSMPPGTAMMIGDFSSSPAASRNHLIESFLTQPSLEWICFIDSDMTPKPATVVRLLSHNVDVVGALCFERGEPFTACFAPLPGKEIYNDTVGLAEVDFAGTGCMLVRRRVIEALQYPYFEHTVPGTGEDVLFCRKARQLGFKVYLDCDLCVGHMTTRPVEKELALMYQQLPRIAGAAPVTVSRRRAEAKDRAEQDQLDRARG
jgi:hypothetical protein